VTGEREVAITGLGAVTALGRDVTSLWDALVAGRSGVSAIASFDATPYPSRIAGEIHGYTAPKAIDAERARRLDRGALFGVDAGLQALADSRLELTQQNATQLGVVFGSARPGETAVFEGQQAFHERGAAGIAAGYVPRTLANAPAAAVAAALGARGPAVAVSAGGASGTAALSLAAALVRSGAVQVAVAGGADAPVTPAALAAFCALEALSKRNDEPEGACRPFDADADGLVLAEGAGALVLEDAALAQQRGARVYARLAGAGYVTEPAAGTPAAAEAGRAMQAALREPALLQSEIDYLCAYACGAPELDRMESDAVKRIFGLVTASKVTISAPKSMLGHLLGASGAIDAIVCAKAIETGVIPPTINLERPAEGCDLDYTANEARRQPVRNAMCYAYGFGGHHVALSFSAP
jgi:3-oxoacyl-(acyl-carrier-protein) synthase